jgi:hypothetical protein
VESHCIDSKYCEDTELYGQDLVCTGHLYWNSHSKLLVFVLQRNAVVLFDQILLAVGQDRSVWPKLEPYLENTLALDIAERRVELEVGLESFVKEELDLHGERAPVEEQDLLSVELLVDQHLQ